MNLITNTQCIHLWTLFSREIKLIFEAPSGRVISVVEDWEQIYALCGEGSLSIRCKSLKRALGVNVSELLFQSTPLFQTAFLTCGACLISSSGELAFNI